MKIYFSIFSFYLLISFNVYSQDFRKLSDTDVDSKKVQFAAKFATDFLVKLKGGSFYEFNDEAIDVLKNQLSEENQKAIYKQLKEKFGDFQSLKYTETWVQKNDLSHRIYRFKGKFDNSSKMLEIRVVLEGADKIAGFWIRPWLDMLN